MGHRTGTAFLLVLATLALLWACDGEVLPAELEVLNTPSGTPTPGPDSGGVNGPVNPEPQQPQDAGGGNTVPVPVPDAGTALPRFSFFVTSIEAIRALSGSQNGFGGDLRFGEASGLAGADKICRMAAERGLAGAGEKQWRAFLSVSTGAPGGGPIHAIDRIGDGPWYDRNGRVFAMDRAALLAGPRPQGTDPQIRNDFPNERGEPNRQGVDNHDTLTGSNTAGQYAGNIGATCNDWTTTVGNAGRPNIGHSWPRVANNLNNGGHWISDHQAPGCGAGVNLIQNGAGDGTPIVGGGGGYGGIYCFALTP